MPDPVKDYLAKYGGAQPARDDPVKKYLAQYGGAQQSAPEETGTQHAVGAGRQVLEGATMGWGGPLDAAQQAISGALIPEGKYGSNLFTGSPASGYKGFDVIKRYHELRDADTQGMADFRARHKKEAIAENMAGGILPAIGAGAPRLLAEKGVGLGSKMWAGAKAGSTFGAVQGAGEGEGAGGTLKGAALGAALGGPLGAAAVPLVEGGMWAARALHVPEGLKALATRFGAGETASGAGSIGKSADATNVLGQRVNTDRAGGYAPPKPVTGPGAVPFMPLNEAGPATSSLAENIVQNKREGAGLLQRGIEGRQQQMRPSVQAALEHGTGQKAGTGMQRLDAELARSQQEADDAFGVARATTEGQGIESPLYEQIRETPVGKDADAYARAAKQNRMRAAPTKPGEPVPPGGFSPEQWQHTVDLAKERGMALPGMEEGEPVELPDAEHLHFMKQYLAHTARLGQNDGANGLRAVTAQGAMDAWGGIRDLLPPIWQRADDIASKNFRLIDAINSGRNIGRTDVNPAGPAKRAVSKSLYGVEKKLAAGSAAEQSGFQQGAAQNAFADLSHMPLRATSPAPTFAKNDVQLQQLGHAFPASNTDLAPAVEGSPSRFQHVISDWDRMGKQATELLKGSQTAGRGIEQAARTGDQSGAAALGHLGGNRFMSAFRTLFAGASKESQATARHAMDAEIARMLTDPKGLNTLSEAAVTNNLRRAVEQALRQTGTRVGGAHPSAANPLNYFF